MFTKHFSHYWPWMERGQTAARKHRGRRLSALTGCTESLWNRMKEIKKYGGASLHWPVSGVGLPCGKARLFRWKMVLRLVSPARACGRPACRTAWFMRAMISVVATWINHVARIKLLLSDAQHFPRCLRLRVEIIVIVAVVLEPKQYWFLMVPVQPLCSHHLSSYDICFW